MGGSCAACSSPKCEGNRACMAVSRAAGLHVLYDSSSNSSRRRSWKGAGRDLFVSGKIVTSEETFWLLLWRVFLGVMLSTCCFITNQYAVETQKMCCSYYSESFRFGQGRNLWMVRSLSFVLRSREWYIGECIV